MAHRTRVQVLGLLFLAGLAACSPGETKERHFERGNEFFNQKKYAEAIIEYRSALALDSNYGPARSKLADAYGAQGETETAFRESLKAADLLPNDASALVRVARYQILARQYVDAKSRLQQAVRIDPNNVEAQLLLGNALAGLRDLDALLTEIEEAIEIEPNRSQTLQSLAQGPFAKGEHELARAAVEQGVELAPASASAWLALANVQWRARDFAQAEESLKKAVALEPSNWLANRGLAALYLLTDRASAAETYLNAMTVATRSPDARFALAEYYVRTHRLDEAKAILQPMVKRPAMFARAQSRLADIEYSEGRRDAARVLIEEVLDREPNNGTALVTRTRWLLREGRRTQALRNAKAAVAANPNSVVARFLLASAYAARREKTAALNTFLEVIRLSPRVTAAKTQIAGLHLDLGDAEGAVHMAQEAALQSPDDVDARLMLIRAWSARGDDTRAWSELERVKKEAGQVASVYAVLGVLRAKQGDATAARAAYAHALAIDPSLFEALHGITVLDLKDGKVVEAKARVEARLKALPEDPDLGMLAVTVYLAGRDRSSAERLLRTIIEADQTNTDAYNQLGRLLARPERLASALIEFQERVSRAPDSVPAHTVLAMLLQAQNRAAEAKAQYEHVLTIEPTSAAAASRLAWLYAQDRENLDRALTLATQAVEASPMQADFHDTLGWVYYQKGVAALAVLPFERAVAADPSNPTHYYHLGLAYRRMRRFDEARQAFRSALKIRPDYPEARQALAEPDSGGAR